MASSLDRNDSNEGMPGVIADPVHRFLSFTSLERTLLDHRVTQRLRYIAQSGLAHMVFPAVQTSRFSHCLGTMHLASAFLQSSFQNSNEEERILLGRAMTEAAEVYGGGFAGAAAAPDADAQRVLQAHFFVPDPETHEISLDAVVAAEQALRLAALFHDLGHLPFSHDFEEALAWIATSPDTAANVRSVVAKLKDQNERKLAIHERVGHQVARLLLREITPSLGQRSNYVNNVFTFAFEILTMKSIPDLELDYIPSQLTPAQRAIMYLHSLVSGELDVDRSDYLLRDGRNYGFDFATYGLDRLLATMVLGQLPDERLVLAVRPQGLSSVESFLLSRSRSYQFGVRHHKVTQLGASIRYSMGHIVNDLADQAPIRVFLQDIDEFADMALNTNLPNTSTQRAKERDILDRFAQYDDIWWTTIMRNRLDDLRQRLKTLPKGKQHDQNHHDYEDRIEWLALVCQRARGPVSLWKRPDDFSDLLRGSDVASGDGLAPVAQWNAKLDEMRSSGEDEPWSEVVRQLASDGVLVIRHHFNPWSVDDQEQSEGLYVQDKCANLQPVSRYSSLVTALPELWRNDVQVHAFATSRAAAHWTAEKVLRTLDAALVSALTLAQGREDGDSTSGVDPTETEGIEA